MNNNTAWVLTYLEYISLEMLFLMLSIFCHKNSLILNFYFTVLLFLYYMFPNYLIIYFEISFIALNSYVLTYT